MRKSDIKYFKKMLQERKEQIVKNIIDSCNDINELQNNKAVDEFDMASISTDSNLEYSISAKQRIELEKINKALLKIENGVYGICEMCDEEIAIARLKAHPSTRFCISCKELSEKTTSKGKL